MLAGRSARRLPEAQEARRSCAAVPARRDGMPGGCSAHMAQAADLSPADGPVARDLDGGAPARTLGSGAQRRHPRRGAIDGATTFSSWPTSCGAATSTSRRSTPWAGTSAGWPRSPPESPSSPASPTSPPSPPATGSSWSTRARASWPKPCTRPCGGGRRSGSTPPIYSHGHIDHVFGVGVWEEESSTEGWPAPVVVAHDAVPARFDRYIVTAGYNEVINQRQFGVPGLRWPTEYRYPDRTYAQHLELDVGGVGLGAAPRPGRDRRPHLDLGARAPGAVLRRPLHLGVAQRRQPPEGAALPPRVGRRPAGDGRRSSPRSCSRATASPSSGRPASARR